MILRTTGLALLFASLAACSQPEPEAPAPEASATEEEGALETLATETAQADSSGFTPADYSVEDHWLCLPEKAGSDACSTDLTTTVIDVEDGEVVVTTEDYEAAAEPAIDCFYVYPTTSTDPGGNSDLQADPAELRPGSIIWKTIMMGAASFWSVTLRAQASCKACSPIILSVRQLRI